MPISLIDIRPALVDLVDRQHGLPCHVAAFVGWIMSDQTVLRARVEEVVELPSQMRHPEHVAAMGYAAASGLLSDPEISILRDEIEHLSGRVFFAAGRPLRFEVDGVAQLGVTLAVKSYNGTISQEWLTDLLVRTCKEVSNDEWQQGLVRAATLCIGGPDVKICPPDLAVALAEKGIGKVGLTDFENGWSLASSIKPHSGGPARDAVKLLAFDAILARHSQITIGEMTRSSLIHLLKCISRSMRLWTFESVPRTPKSPITRWGIENEYHVQNLLWSILAPVLPDLEDEENLPSIGHKNPRADLGVPSLRTIIEVKFMRRSGQSACAEIIEEIAADASLYLSKSTAYDNIVCFVWDDLAQTEQHDELRSGLESIKGISAAIILPRPSKMVRE